jgi:hypothetical protein
LLWIVGRVWVWVCDVGVLTFADALIPGAASWAHEADQALMLAAFYFGAFAVQLFVLIEERWVCVAEPGEEDVLCRAAQMKRQRVDAFGASAHCGVDDCRDLFGVVVDAGHKRRDHDAGGDATEPLRTWSMTRFLDGGLAVGRWSLAGRGWCADGGDSSS